MGKRKRRGDINKVPPHLGNFFLNLLLLGNLVDNFNFCGIWMIYYYCWKEIFCFLLNCQNYWVIG